MTKKPSNQTIELPHDTSLLLYSDKKNFPATISKKDRLNLIPLPEAICRATPSYFQNNNLNAEICLKLVPSAAEISRVLLTLQSPTAAARVAGAYIRVGDRKWADQITRDMAATGQTINPSDPFSKKPLCLGGIERLASPYAGRIGAMWRRMRDVVIDSFPAPPSHRDSEKKSLSMIEKLYTEDAYHSLSIEGYQVTEDLIRRIKEGAWNPDAERADNEQRNALAAKGYLGAFNAVTASVRKVFEGDHPGKVLSADCKPGTASSLLRSCRRGS